MRYLPDGVT
jgi:hypothetical protein